MIAESLFTDFAPAERSSDEEIRNAHERVVKHLEASPLLKQMLDNLFDMVLVLDQHRQAVYCNQTIVNYVGAKDEWGVLGKRPGEIFKCVYIQECKADCGTTRFCEQCGSAKAILGAQEGAEMIEECSIMQEDSEQALDLAVSATRLPVGKDSYVLFVLKDISDQKRRDVLEQIFFHDILNVATVVWSSVELMRLNPEADRDQIVANIHHASKRLMNEIRAQRDLLNAENKTLQIKHTVLNSLDMLKESIEMFEQTSSVNDKELHIDDDAAAVTFQNDATLVGRVLANMIKNALEASAKGQRITVGCTKIAGYVEFWVHNEAVMPKDVQLSIFRRSFTTKGKGRGLGTYSMKLLTERYLGGSVSFASQEGKGTTFFARYPL